MLPIFPTLRAISNVAASIPTYVGFLESALDSGPASRKHVVPTRVKRWRRLLRSWFAYKERINKARYCMVMHKRIQGEWSSHTTYTGHTIAQKCSGVLDVRHSIPQLRACSTIVSRTTYLTCQSAIQLGASAVVFVQPQATSAVIGYPSLGLVRTQCRTLSLLFVRFQGELM
ncbi:hypothetical protein BO79DRAFT_239553 [Aspergillus costaricaensis CBS 115574]|uniref:Uncharacterized protein n=1 Tax=Aspergillus costaricaensis CBS 115574 TaxID=1448317 RepID=A0ACD1I6U7_9EURO|nr:hypothetical protein BO79DRAFT_239553 [Aspergillus costaricaensis CBS 115574]RAK85997.1 hypothetical protein BO79DRAFT_239553 [Aspergillus costaricaensis CBS 115574]